MFLTFWKFAPYLGWKPIETIFPDAFSAAMIYATLEQLPIESVMDYAMAAGIAAIGHERTINPQMSISLLESILKEYKQ